MLCCGLYTDQHSLRQTRAQERAKRKAAKLAAQANAGAV